MAFGTAGKRMMGPLLTANFVMYVIVLGLAGWSLDEYINGQNHPRYLHIFALVAGTTGACSVIVGSIHLRAWRSSSLAGAASIALVSWAVTALTFGVACKQIGIGNRGRRLRTLEAFIIILAITELIYLVVLHAGFVNSRYGPVTGATNVWGWLIYLRKRPLQQSESSIFLVDALKLQLPKSYTHLSFMSSIS